MPETDYDVIIVGAGPGGCACAISLADSGLSVCLIEKSSFPRDKICGDALSPDVLNQLSNLNGDLQQEFLAKYGARKADVTGVRIVSANGEMAELNLSTGNREISGWVVKRIDFDNFLFEHMRTYQHVTILQDHKVTDIDVAPDLVHVTTNGQPVTADLVIGADGAHSIVSKKLTAHKMDRDHYCGAVRGYYRNVEGFHADGMIELHFYKRLLPGYFWVFPLPDNEANVGLGMLSSYISKRSVNLKRQIRDVIANEPGLKERFADAELVGEMQGFGLPLGSKKRELSGERFMLIGDAASLIDPITGEGVGNAIRSGRYAADQVRSCFETGDFSAANLKQYDDYLYSKVWGEMRFSRALQTGFRYSVFINFLVALAGRSARFNAFLNRVISDAGFWGDGFNVRRWWRHWRG
jgi:geranylgeranyl reductase family protein